MQTIDNNTVKYVVILLVNGKKEQKVYTYKNTTKEIVHYATTVVPTVIVPTRVVQTVINNQKVTVTNSISQVEILYPETQPVIEIITGSDLTVNSVVVVAESNSTGVTVVAQGTTSSELIVQEYTSQESVITKVDEQVINIIDIVTPRPISSLPIDPVVIAKVPAVEVQIKKVLNIAVT